MKLLCYHTFSPIKLFFFISYPKTSENREWFQDLSKGGAFPFRLCFLSDIWEQGRDSQGDPTDIMSYEKKPELCAKKWRKWESLLQGIEDWEKNVSLKMQKIVEGDAGEAKDPVPSTI